jgi:hypothetical protein
MSAPEEFEEPNLL